VITSPSTAFVERLGMIVGVALVLCMLFTTVAPYFVIVPPASVRLIDQQQTILQSVLMVLVGYLWGNSAGNKSKDSAIESLAKTAQNATTPVDPASIVLAPGEAATATATEAGTVIEPSNPGKTP
jgi:hypothetical protein